MNFMNLLTKHKVIEMNQSTGLRVGHMVAQAEFKPATVGPGYIDNGHILKLDADGTLVLLSAAQAEETSTIFVHYSEEYMVTGNNTPLEYFTVEFDEDAPAYPRAIALYVNDAFTTDNFTTELTLTAGNTYFATPVNGVLKVVAAPVETKHGFLAEVDALPSGKAAMRFIYLGAYKATGTD